MQLAKARGSHNELMCDHWFSADTVKRSQAVNVTGYSFGRSLWLKPPIAIMFPLT